MSDQLTKPLFPSQTTQVITISVQPSRLQCGERLRHKTEHWDNFTLPEEQRRRVKFFYLSQISLSQMDWIEFSNSDGNFLLTNYSAHFQNITCRYIESMNFTKEFCKFFFQLNQLCQMRLLNELSHVNHIILWLWLWGITTLLWLGFSFLIILVFSFASIFRSICVSPADSERDNVSGRYSSLMVLLKAKIFLAYFSLPRGFLLLICNSF